MDYKYRYLPNTYLLRIPIIGHNTHTNYGRTKLFANQAMVPGWEMPN